MPASWLPVLRAILLFGVVTNVLQGTILFDWVQRAIIGRWLALGQRRGQSARPAAFTSARMQRVFSLLAAVVFLGIWWFLGTPSGVLWFQTHAGPRA